MQIFDSCVLLASKVVGWGFKMRNGVNGLIKCFWEITKDFCSWVEIEMFKKTIEGSFQCLLTSIVRVIQDDQIRYHHDARWIRAILIFFSNCRSRFWIRSMFKLTKIFLRRDACHDLVADPGRGGKKRISSLSS